MGAGTSPKLQEKSEIYWQYDEERYSPGSRGECCCRELEGFFGVSRLSPVVLWYHACRMLMQRQNNALPREGTNAGQFLDLCSDRGIKRSRLMDYICTLLRFSFHGWTRRAMLPCSINSMLLIFLSSLCSFGLRTSPEYTTLLVRASARRLQQH
jgi:hypothetical protein